MTLDRYGHLLPGLGDALVDALEAAHTAAQTPLPNVVNSCAWPLAAEEAVGR
jgi:hypothetical protein